MNLNPFDEALEAFHSKGTEAAVTLKDGSILQGKIKRYDGYVIFLEKDIEYMVYRHSILKLSQATERQAEKATTPARPEPRTPSLQPKKAAFQKKRPAKREPLQPSQKGPEPGSFSRMGEELQKWLKSQKGNE